MNTESHRIVGILHPWIPVSGHRLRKAGVYFDAVRLPPAPGEQLATRLEALTDGAPGPVIAHANGGRWLYFLVAPGSTTGRRWPRGVTRLGPGPQHAYVGVPALHGPTWPLAWRCAPRPDRGLVDTALLHGALAGLRVAAP
jgi:hypothetical protein